MQHVSSSLSKIPYGGFSPVRLQTGEQPRPSPGADGLSARPAYPHPRPTYTWPPLPAQRGVNPRAGAGPTVVEPRLKRHSPPPPPALQSRGPWLARGFCCPAGSSPTMASCETLAPLPAIYALYAGSLPYGLVWAGSERFPNLLRMSVPAVPPSVPRWTDRVRLAVPSSIALAFAFSAEARHPHAHARRFSRGLRNEAAKFTSCYGPAGLLALHRQGRLRPSLRPPGRPGRASGITMRAHSQFPQPDLHRLDMRPYGLHAGAQMPDGNLGCRAQRRQEDNQPTEGHRPSWVDVLFPVLLEPPNLWGDHKDEGSTQSWRSSRGSTYSWNF
jgi:hypothetical protein